MFMFFGLVQTPTIRQTRQTSNSSCLSCPLLVRTCLIGDRPWLSLPTGPGQSVPPHVHDHNHNHNHNHHHDGCEPSLVPRHCHVTTISGGTVVGLACQLPWSITQTQITNRGILVVCTGHAGSEEPSEQLKLTVGFDPDPALYLTHRAKKTIQPTYTRPGSWG